MLGVALFAGHGSPPKKYASGSVTSARSICSFYLSRFRMNRTQALPMLCLIGTGIDQGTSYPTARESYRADTSKIIISSA